MSENMSDFRANSDTREPVRDAGPIEVSLELDELLAILERARADVDEAHDRAARAIARDHDTPGARATAERWRAHDALGRARLRACVIFALWDSGAREGEVESARFEKVRVRHDGVALVNVLAKREHWRTIAFSPPTWRLVREYHEEHGVVKGRVPGAGRIFPLTARSIRRAVHDLAVRAGVQELAAAQKKSHRYHVTPKAIREFGEGHLVYDLGWNPKLAAKVHDHTEVVQQRYYLRGRNSATARAALDRSRAYAARGT
jgi:hypothetical protein